jgi:hypothetical protein
VYKLAGIGQIAGIFLAGRRLISKVVYDAGMLRALRRNEPENDEIAVPDATGAQEDSHTGQKSGAVTGGWTLPGTLFE